MQVTSNTSKSVATLTVTIDESELSDIKRSALNTLRPKVKADGFRPGKAPDNVVIKQLGDAQVQQEVIESAINRFYPMAATKENIQPLMQPDIQIKTFVPYTELVFTAEVSIVPSVTLPDLNKISVKRTAVTVSEKDIDEVVERLRLQSAEKKDVTRAAKDTDQVWIDFEGKDADGKPVEGASGKDYPLAIGSNTFIPGFEEEVIGLKAGDDKTFDITFPKDYHAASLAGAKVTFAIKVNKVQEVVLPELNEEFIKSLAPMATEAELRADIKKQLEQEKTEQAERDHREKVIDAIVSKTKVEVPQKLVESVMHDMRHDFEQNLSYRGLTVEQYVTQQGFANEQEFEEKELVPSAQKRANSSLMLTEAAKALTVDVSREELDQQLESMKKQYTDEQMQKELDSPQARQDIASRLLTQKTIDELVKTVTT